MLTVKQRQLVGAVRAAQQRYQSASEAQLREASHKLRYAVQSGTSLIRVVPDGFGLVIEAARRTIGLVHYDVQILGGIQLVRGRIVEMKTGEGKTLTATLPVFLYALGGRGAHIATVNDYLATRDAEDMGPVYRALGLTVGAVRTDDSPQQRAAAYRKDITYGTAKEFGFDFLRDRLARQGAMQPGSPASRASQMVMRQLHFVLVDEADSVLIDEARTPLIIGMTNSQDEQIARDCYQWAAHNAPAFHEGSDYRYEHDRRAVKLRPAGINRLRGLPQSPGTRAVGMSQLYRYMENAIRVHRDFHRDRNYAVVDHQVVIIDEFTGRPAEGRKWQHGIHQAVEAKEQLQITPQTRQAATITIQTFFRLYRHCAGMTGTAWTSRREFQKVYKKRVARVPTNKPLCRTQLPVHVCKDAENKWHAIAKETSQLIQAGRAVLIGTRSVDKSEQLSRCLHQRRLEHQVLNARYLEKEAEIVARAGQAGRITVATNMAGRGTDIKLDPNVRKQGGLHVILSEVHEARRIDWQLIGRGSRQGDPGSYRIYLALDDEILQLGLGPARAARLRRMAATVGKDPARLMYWFRRAQRALERRHLVDRMILLRQDKERRKQLDELGQDPFLHTTE